MNHNSLLRPVWILEEFMKNNYPEVPKGLLIVIRKLIEEERGFQEKLRITKQFTKRIQNEQI